MMNIVNGTEQTTTDLIAMGRAARAASRVLAPLNTDVKNAALLAIADELEAQSAEILAQNALDIAAGREKGLSDALLDRLLLTEQRIARLAADSRAVAALPDPVGADFMSRVLPNGLRLSKRRIPIGVLGVIYEARPNVTIDIAVLSLKTGNAAIMRGGSETLRSNIALTQVIQTALEKSGFIERIERKTARGGNLTNQYSLKGLIEAAKPFAEEHVAAREARKKESVERATRKRPAKLELVKK